MVQNAGSKTNVSTDENMKPQNSGLNMIGKVQKLISISADEFALLMSKTAQ